MAGMRDSAGTHLGYTDWQEMTQERVNQFADATDDHQFIHVDPERAKQTPFGGTIAHGFLTPVADAPRRPAADEGDRREDGGQLRARPGPLPGAAAGRRAVARRRRDPRGDRGLRRPAGQVPRSRSRPRAPRSPCASPSAWSGSTANGVTSIDVDRLKAIDVHTHAERNHGEAQDPVTDELLGAAAKYFGAAPVQPTAQEVADYYRERDMVAVVFTVDDEAGMGRKRLGNDEVLEAARGQPRRADPVRQRRPAQGQARRPRGARADRGRRARLQVPPEHPGVLAQRPRALTRCMR